MNKLTQEKKDFLFKNFPHCSNLALSQKLELSVSTIARFAGKNGLKKDRNLSQEKTAQLISAYVSKKFTLRELEIEFHISRERIKKIIELSGVEYRNKSKALQRFKINDKFFEKIDTEQKAYWLGFIYADGNIYKTHLKITLCSKDENILNNFLRDIESEHKIYREKRPSKSGTKIYSSSSAVIVNKKIVEDLYKLGCKPRKSFNLEFPNEEVVPKTLLNHFLRGYFDGDGSVGHYEYKNNKTGLIRAFRWNLMSTSNFCEAVKKILMNLGITTSITIHQDKRISIDMKRISVNGSYATNFGRRSLKIIHDFLYKDANLFLQRKKDKFDLILNFQSEYTKWPNSRYKNSL